MAEQKRQGLITGILHFLLRRQASVVIFVPIDFDTVKKKVPVWSRLRHLWDHPQGPWQLGVVGVAIDRWEGSFLLSTLLDSELLRTVTLGWKQATNLRPILTDTYSKGLDMEQAIEIMLTDEPAIPSFCCRSRRSNRMRRDRDSLHLKSHIQTYYLDAFVERGTASIITIRLALARNALNLPDNTYFWFNRLIINMAPQTSVMPFSEFANNWTSLGWLKALERHQTTTVWQILWITYRKDYMKQTEDSTPRGYDNKERANFIVAILTYPRTGLLLLFKQAYNNTPVS